MHTLCNKNESEKYTETRYDLLISLKRLIKLFFLVSSAYSRVNKMQTMEMEKRQGMGSLKYFKILLIFKIKIFIKLNSIKNKNNIKKKLSFLVLNNEKNN